MAPNLPLEPSSAGRSREAADGAAIACVGASTAAKRVAAVADATTSRISPEMKHWLAAGYLLIR
jgi:hypothetical protein